MDNITISSKLCDVKISIEDFSDMGIKKPCLCIRHGNTSVKIASFNDEESAKLFVDAFTAMTGAEGVR